MGTQENKEKVLQIIDGYMNNDLSVFRNILHKKGFFRVFGNGENKENFNIERMITKGNDLFEFLDYSFNIEYMVAENNTVVVLTEKTEMVIQHFRGFPKGKSTSFMVFNSYHFKDGLIYTIDRISDDIKRNNDLGQTVSTTENNRVESYLNDLKAFGII